MRQGEKTMAQYYVELRQQAGKCQYGDAPDIIRTHLIQTMNDKRLRREAMLKSYDLDELLKQAANREEVERQAASIEAAGRTDHAHQVYSKRGSGKQAYKSHQGKEKGKVEKNKPQEENKDVCSYCGQSHTGPRSECPASGKQCRKCKKQGHFAKMCQGEKPKPSQQKHKGKQYAKQVTGENKNKSESDDDWVFSVAESGKKNPVVDVFINGVRGRVNVDSCSSVNVMDFTQFQKIQAASKTPLVLQQSSTKLFAYAQKEAIPLKGKFSAVIRSCSTKEEAEAEFQVIEGSSNSRPLLSLSTGVDIGVISVANAVRREDFIKEFPEVFTGLGCHKYWKAQFIVDPDVQPVVQKTSKNPLQLGEEGKGGGRTAFKIGHHRAGPR